MKLADLLIPQDKANHAIDGALVYLVVAALGRFFHVHGHREIALTAALIVGVLKEVWDGYQTKKAIDAGFAPTHTADPFDAIATFAGALAMYAAGEV